MKKATVTSDAGCIPMKNVPAELFPTEVLLSLRNFKPINSFNTAVKKFANLKDPAVTFREIWDSAIKIGQQKPSKRVGVEELADAQDNRYREGKLLGMEEGKILGR
jgi:hypothetical protein